jgi:hypothetical protein
VNHPDHDQEAFGRALDALQLQVDCGMLPLADLEALLLTIERRCSALDRAPGAVPNRAQIVGCFSLAARAIARQHGGRFVCGNVCYLSDGTNLSVQKVEGIP